MTELAKTFDPAAIEARWYAHWEESGLFRPERGDATPFTIVMPPPNVTGSLHIGHALDVTLQDILTRHARMQGKDALWVVGTDHAGIATQMVVERQMAEKQDKRTNYSRDEFIAKVWEWKAESGGQITQQLRRLGASCDWANERFTMDEGFSAAVTKVFVDLYNKGLLYRDKRLVNWDPGLKTAISDLEVETREVQGKFWHLRYPLADGSGHIGVATTRPETMLADMAVAVNPSDERYTALIGRQVKLPITGRLIPIVADDHADPELGSGAVKVTPGHDFNDFEVGKRAGIAAADMLNMFDVEAKVVQTADGLIPDALLGIAAKDARAAVVELLDAEGALERVEDRVIATPFGDRSGVVIEPWLTDQWYVDAAKLVGPVLEATRSGAIKIVPESWSKTWFNWLENIQPWCVSRQLWWGHRIPAWFGASREAYDRRPFDALKTTPAYAFSDGFVVVAETDEEVRRQFAAYYGVDPNNVDLENERADFSYAGKVGGNIRNVYRDLDVLDTWFSSALWPFATLGWPDTTPDLARHYPNDVLISGFDILFFWDARMAMQGLEFMKEAPWKTLYLHGLVRDANGQKMSKSKGNTVDPLGLIDRYGADALRFTMAAMESQGRDIKLDEKRVEGYRNFATKLWNAARFLQMNGVKARKSTQLPDAKLAMNRWIIGELSKTLRSVDKAYDKLRFDRIAYELYHFVWHTFCDWYLELIKGSFELETKRVSAWIFDQILIMLHPLMPFITEEIWHAMGSRNHDLIVAKWPRQFNLRHARSRQQINWVINFVSEVRAVRAELNLPWSEKLSVFLDSTDPALLQRFMKSAPPIVRMARIRDATFRNLDVEIQLEDRSKHSLQTWTNVQKGGAQFVVGRDTYVLNLEGVIDLEAEKARLSKAIATADKDRDGLAARLANPAFAERAKPEAVAKARADLDARAAEAERLGAALARLG